MSRERRITAAVIAATKQLAGSLGDKAWGPISMRSTGGIVAAFDWSTYEATLTALFETELGQAAVYAARMEAVHLDRAAVGKAVGDGVSYGWSLDRTDEGMMAWARAHAAELVTAISKTTRQAIRDLVYGAFHDQYTVRDLARMLRLTVGPLPRDVAAIARAHAANIEILMESGVPYNLAAERADALARRMAEKAVRRRALTIARTEIIRASNQGKLASWEEADRLGLMAPDAYKKWEAFDPCPICADLNGRSVSWRDSFPGGYDAPPAHPRCRCAMYLVDPPTSSRAASKRYDLMEG